MSYDDKAPPYERGGQWFRLVRVDSVTQVEMPAEAPARAPEPPKTDPAPIAKSKGKK